MSWALTTQCVEEVRLEDADHLLYRRLQFHVRGSEQLGVELLQQLQGFMNVWNEGGIINFAPHPAINSK